jgi:NADPH:quinone reductase-like Zn-dependent oxidoreductase
MRAARVHHFGAPEVIVVEELPRPQPGPEEVLVRIAAAGVGPWDDWIREGKSVVKPSLPLTLGSDLSGIVEATGAGVTTLHAGDWVYGVTNPEFTGSCADFAVAKAGMIACKPVSLNSREAASAPVVAVTAWQMLFDYAEAVSGQTVLIHGAAGNVGAYAVQFAAQAGLHVVTTASASDASYVQSLGAETVIDDRTSRFEELLANVDTVGGETAKRSIQIIKPGGILVSVVSQPDSAPGDLQNVRKVFFLVQVTTERLNTIASMFDEGKLMPRVGTVLPLAQVRAAHEMLAGAPHEPGKIVLDVGGF